MKPASAFLFCEQRDPPDHPIIEIMPGQRISQAGPGILAVPGMQFESLTTF